MTITTFLVITLAQIQKVQLASTTVHCHDIKKKKLNANTVTFLPVHSAMTQLSNEAKIVIISTWNFFFSLQKPLKLNLFTGSWWEYHQVSWIQIASMMRDIMIRQKTLHFVRTRIVFLPTFATHLTNAILINMEWKAEMGNLHIFRVWVWNRNNLGRQLCSGAQELVRNGIMMMLKSSYQHRKLTALKVTKKL